MDIVFIKELTIITNIGIYDWEQKIRQKLVFDIEIGCDNHRAAASNSIKECLSYADISEAIIQYVEPNRFTLLERVAEEVSELLLKRFKSPWVRLSVSKPGAIVYASRVGVIIERGIRSRAKF